MTMYKKYFLFLILFFINGCSSKVEYPQLTGNSIDYYKNNYKNKNYSNLNKQELLKKVDLVANNIFSNLLEKNKKLNEQYYNQILNQIYLNKKVEK